MELHPLRGSEDCTDLRQRPISGSALCYFSTCLLACLGVFLHSNILLYQRPSAVSEPNPRSSVFIGSPMSMSPSKTYASQDHSKPPINADERR
jgi:hypothetical protein